MRHTQSFLHAKSIKESFCFPVNFTKFLKKPFLQLKLWLQNRRIYTPLPWPLRRLSYKPPRLKQHHCNKSREFKILQQMSSEYLLSAPPYHNWLLFVELVIHGTGVRAFTCRWVVGEMNHDAWLVSFFVRKKVLVNNLDKTCYFRKQERSL